MRNKKQEFPHPLLSAVRSDYTEGEFSLSMNQQPSDAADFIFNLSYNLFCEGLALFVSEGKAKVIVKICSSTTTYRTMHEFIPPSNSCTVNIGKMKVAKTISLQSFIVATKPIEAFFLPEHNPLYFSGATFDLRKGDILAESIIYEVKLDDSELQKPISSIFQISQLEEATESIIANYSDEKIRIFLSSKLYQVYHNLRRKNEFRRYLSAVIVLPVLVEALDYIRTDPGEDGENFEGRRWYRVIMENLKRLNIDLETTDSSMVTVANLLLGDISWDALNSFKTTIDDINRNSDTIEMEAD